MRSFRFVIASIALLLVAFPLIAGQKIRIRMNLKNSDIIKQNLPPSMDIGGQNLKEQTLDIIGSRDYFQLLKQDGYPVEIAGVQPAQVDERYLTPQKINSLIQRLANDYPQLVHVETIGKSLQGRPILAVRISTSENLNSKPTILFNGMHHAREVMTTEVTTDIMVYLARNYDNVDTPWVNAWLDHLAIWIIPQLNPDGNNIVWQQDNWWRKNARMVNDEIFGVDLNRNYPFQWGMCRGSSGDPSAQTYRGASPASEPETQALMKLVKQENIAMNISYHSYSELVIAPYGCQNQYSPENFILSEMGHQLAKRLKTDDDKGTYSYGTGWELLYPVDGEDISWMYNEVNTMSYVIEVNSDEQGFQPDYEIWRNKTVLRQRAGWQYLLSRLLNGPQVRGRMLDAKTGAPVDGTVYLNEVKYRNEKPRQAKRGFYQKMLAPGSYELIFSAPGYESQSIAISLSDTAVVQDVYLERGIGLEH
jgi:carboxypeptidase T